MRSHNEKITILFRKNVMHSCAMTNMNVAVILFIALLVNKPQEVMKAEYEKITSQGDPDDLDPADITKCARVCLCAYSTRRRSSELTTH